MGTSQEDIVKKIGEPSGWFGEKIKSPYYILRNGTYVILYFDYPEDLKKLYSITVVNEEKEICTIKEKEFPTIKVMNFDVAFTEIDRSLSEEDFKNLKFGTSYEEITKMIGKSNGVLGSGILSPFYKLDNGLFAICYFSDLRMTELRRISIVNESKRLYDLKEWISN